MKTFLGLVTCLILLGSACALIDELGTEDVRRSVIYSSSVHAGSPGIVRLGSGEHLLVFREGPFENTGNGVLMLCRSDKGGKTWSVPDTVVRSSWDCRDPSIVQLQDGLIIINFHQIRTAGVLDSTATGIGCFTVQSFDNGKTFTAPRMIGMSGWDWTATSDKIVQLEDGRLLLPVFGVYGGVPTAAVLLSDEGGESWERMGVIAEDSGGGVDFVDPSLTVLPDGKIICMLTVSGSEDYLYWSTSEDKGENWSPRENTRIHGRAGVLHVTPDGILVCAFRDLSPVGVSIVRSYDQGFSWENESLLAEGCATEPGMTSSPSLITQERRLIAVHDGLPPEGGDEGMSALHAATFRIDRLPAPQGFSASVRKGVVDLRWNPVPDTRYYLIYRDTIPNFDLVPGYPGWGNGIATSVEPSYTDTAVDSGRTFQYRITAVAGQGMLVPVTGNESEPSICLEISVY